MASPPRACFLDRPASPRAGRSKPRREAFVTGKWIRRVHPHPHLLRLLLLLFAFAGAGAAWALNPDRTITQYNCRTWRRDNGLPVNMVNAISFSEDGRLWLGTSQGLVSFDGIDFHSPTENGLDRIGDRVVATIAPRSSGGLWYGLDNGGYGYFDGKNTHPLQFPPWMTSEPIVRQVLESRGGYLWVATTSGLGQAKGEATLEPMLPDTKADIFSLYEDKNSCVWIGTVEHGIYRWADGQMEKWDGIALEHRIVEAVSLDRQGDIWVASPIGATSPTGVFRYDAQVGAITYPTETYSPKTLFVDSHNTVWIGTFGGGIFRYQNGRLSRFTRLEGLASNDVLCFAEAPDGSLWIGTSDGLTQLSDLKFPMFSKHEGLAYDGALCVAADPAKGGVWVGTPDGLSYYDGRESTNYGVGTTDGFGSNWIKRIFPARNGDLYLIGGQKNLDLFSGGKVVKTWREDQWPKDMAEDDKGIIVALAGKLMRIENGQFVPYLLKDGESFDLDWINNLLLTEDKVLWLTTNNGVFCVKNGELIDYCKLNGLPPTRYDYLTVDSHGNVWAAQHHGIARCRDGKMHVVNRDQGLYQNYVYAMVTDRLGNFWMDSDRGIFSVSEKELNDVADGIAARLHCRIYEGADAVKSTDKVAIEYSGARSNDGRIWFPTSKGVVMIDPSNIPENRSIPRVSITSIRINGKPYEPGVSSSLEAGPGNIEFDYVALEYIVPKKVQYRYRLVGWDKDWILSGNRRSANYTNLPPGHYRIEVQASNSDGVWDGSSDQCEFELPRRFYETFVFRAAGVLLLLGTGFYLAWIRNVHRRQKELVEANVLMEEKVRERTAELRAEIEVRKRAQEETERLHDQLRATAEASQAATKAKSQFLANMSHEIRTPMNAIVGMSNLLRDTPLSDHQLELIETTHNSAEALLTVLNDILDFSKIEAGKLNIEQLDFDLIDAVEESLDLLSVSASKKQVELGSIIDHDLPAILRGDPSRLRQVLLNLLGNAVKFTQHGSVSISVKLDPSVADGRIGARFEIRDTGIGITPETQKQLFQPFTQADNSTTRRFGGTGLGLAITHQIVNLMGGTVGVESTLGVGSTFWFTLPLHPAGKSAAPQPAEVEASPVSGLRLLVLNTSSLVQQVLMNHAKAWNVQFTIAENRDDAVRLAKVAADAGAPFDAIIYQKAPDAPKGAPELPLVAIGDQSLRIVLLTSLQESKDTLILPSGVVAVVPAPLRTKRFHRALEAVAGGVTGLQKPACSAEGPSQVPLPPRKPPLAIKILVAEDNVVNQRVVQLQLNKAGYEAKIVGNGIEVLKELEINSYDIILMDCQMPEMDGYETTRRLRQMDTTRNIYIVAMTANSLDGDRERCLEAGMNAYLSKPTREKDLVAALEAAANAKATPA